MPPPPSSTINKSASARAVTALLSPSISREFRSTLPAVVIVLSLLSGIEPASLVAAIYPANIAFVTPSAFTFSVPLAISIEESST